MLFAQRLVNSLFPYFGGEIRRKKIIIAAPTTVKLVIVLETLFSPSSSFQCPFIFIIEIINPKIAIEIPITMPAIATELNIYGPPIGFKIPLNF